MTPHQEIFPLDLRRSTGTSPIGELDMGVQLAHCAVHSPAVWPLMKLSRFQVLMAAMQRTNHPPSETGRAVVNVQPESSADDAQTAPQDSESGRIHQYSRSYSGPAVKRWTLQAIVIGRGHPLALRCGLFNGVRRWSPRRPSIRRRNFISLLLFFLRRSV